MPRFFETIPSSPSLQTCLKASSGDASISCVVEAIAGKATSEALAHAMGNTLATSNKLFATYCPVNVTSLQAVMAARREGRQKLR